MFIQVTIATNSNEQEKFDTFVISFPSATNVSLIIPLVMQYLVTRQQLLFMAHELQKLDASVSPMIPAWLDDMAVLLYPADANHLKYNDTQTLRTMQKAVEDFKSKISALLGAQHDIIVALNKWNDTVARTQGKFDYQHVQVLAFNKPIPMHAKSWKETFAKSGITNEKAKMNVTVKLDTKNVVHDLTHLLQGCNDNKTSCGIAMQAPIQVSETASKKRTREHDAEYEGFFESETKKRKLKHDEERKRIEERGRKPLFIREDCLLQQEQLQALQLSKVISSKLIDEKLQHLILDIDTHPFREKMLDQVMQTNPDFAKMMNEVLFILGEKELNMTEYQ